MSAELARPATPLPAVLEPPEPPAKAVDLDGTPAASWHAALLAFNAEIEQLTERRAHAIEQIQAAMGDATVARIGGVVVATWKPSKPGQVLDRAALESVYGAETIAAFMKPKRAARPFRLTGGDE